MKNVLVKKGRGQLKVHTDSFDNYSEYFLRKQRLEERQEQLHKNVTALVFYLEENTSLY